MPFLQTDKFANVLEPKDKTPIEDLNNVENESPDFWSETIPAAFRRENSIVSGLSRDAGDREDVSFDYVPDVEGYEEYKSRFANTYNESQEQYLKANIDRERQDVKTIEDSGWLGIAASFAAGGLDPVNFVPVGGAASRVFKTGNILKGAASVARAGLISSTVSEAALHASQETRTLGESASNIAAGTLLSGVLGGASGAFKQARVDKIGKSLAEIENNINEFATIPHEGPDLIVGQGITADQAKVMNLDLPDAPLQVGEGGSVGAAQFLETNEIKTLLGSEKLKILTVGDKSSPINRTLTSPNIKTREAVIALSEQSYILEKNVRGVPTQHAIETIIKSEVDVSLVNLSNTLKGAFEKFRDTGFKTANIKDKLGLQKEKMNFSDFKKEIDTAMRNNDTSNIPEAADAAKKLRPLVDDVYGEAVKLGLAPKVEGAPKGAPSWMRRVYDNQAIQNNRSDWQARLRKWFRQNNPELDDLDIEDLVSRTTDNILGRPEDLPIFNTASSGAFKERVFDIPDSMIQDYLIQDIDVVLGGYFKKGIREIEMKRGGFDDEGLRLRLEDMTQQSISDLRKIENAIKKKSLEKQKNAKTDAQIKKIINDEKKAIAAESKKSGKQLNSDKNNITGMRNRLNGTFELNSNNITQYGAFADTIKSANYSRLLGQVMLSSIGDIGQPILINGMTRTLRDQLVPFVRNLGKISREFNASNKTSAFAQSRQELVDMGIAVELILNTRVKNFAELGSSVTGSKLSSYNAATTNAMSYLSGITAWNDTLRSFAGYSAMARILRASQAKKVSKSDVEFLARFGIGDTQLKKIGDQFKIHGRKESGRFASGSANWTDKSAYKDFQNSIRKFTDQTIIVSGQEKPFFASTTAGSVLLQFKSFALSAYSKIFIAGMQQADLAALNGAITMVSLGMLSSYIKGTIAGREHPESISKWILEGVDKSGILGHMFDAHENLARAGIGIPDGPITSYKARSVASAVAGPSYSLLEDTFGTAAWMTNFLKGDRPARSDIRHTRRMIPFQNVFYLRQLFDLAEEGIGNAVGATSTKTKKRNR